MHCPPAAQWQLVGVETFFFLEPDPNTGAEYYIGYTRHAFNYNTGHLPVEHRQGRNLDDPEEVVRIDSFYYNNQCQLDQIISTNYEGPGSYKKNFTYGADNRRRYCLKYLLVGNDQYLLTDSTVYRYQGNTIHKITYHLTKGNMDTATFIYDARQNLISAKLGEYGPGTQQLLQYDKAGNPAAHFNVEALELDPYTQLEWHPEFLLMMQSPRFSRNNYLLRRDTSAYSYNVTLNQQNNVSVIRSIRGGDTDPDFVQTFSHSPAR